ncbi:MAG TPA: hydantoinase/oxoprolinase family protein [Acidimicrobiales bacterium]|jgi:N-methylhydantoinase A|nr:hydantoinase/oxoprolinase family protein [Acidimicrobiales bacterium]
MTQGGYRVGVDVGGTFTDLICITPDGEVLLDKTPTTPADQSEGVLTGVAQLADAFGLDRQAFCANLEAFVHGTTTADNTMIEMSGAPTGLLATEGHRDEIELRRDHKENIWDPAYPPPEPIARRRNRIPIPERCDFEGNVVLALDEAAVRKGVQRLKKLGVESIAVCFLFSFVNPDHERRARELILEEFPDVRHISLSHEVLPRAPEFERASTTLVNAYVAPKISAYVDRLVEKLRTSGFDGQVVLMQSSGGVMPPQSVNKRAVSLLGSGPTGGVMAAAIAAGRSGVHDFVAADMGGTSYDVCLVQAGQPAVATDWNWRHRYYINLPMVDIHSVGAGGGSIARVRQSALLVGPESAGSFPGPVCYSRGGERATVTDSDAALGYLPAKGFAGGRMELDVAAGRAAIERDVAEPMGLSVDDAAWAIQRIVNANMANAVRKVLSQHGADPRRLSLIAYGGGGAVHAWAQARELGIARVLVPKASPAFSALGLLVADYVVDLMRAYVVKLSDIDLSRVRALAAELRREAESELAPARLGEGTVQSDLFAQMCYHGQNFDMSVPLPEGESLSEEHLLDLADRFHRQHETSRGFAFPTQQPLVRGIRLVNRGATPKPPVLANMGKVTDAEQARTGSRPVHFGHGFIDVPTYEGAVLGAGATVTGPALIEEPFTVIVLAPGDIATLDQHGNYDITIAP